LDTIEAILTRRSIRKYDPDKPVSEEYIKLILKAGMSAPSAMNFQPWNFVVINKRSVIDQIPIFHPYATMVKYAPLVIAVCAEIDKSPGFWEQDCSAATENMLLAAHSLGLGAVWLGTYPIDERIDGVRKLLNIPDNIMPMSLISIGHPLQSKPAEDRFDAQKVHYNTW